MGQEINCYRFSQNSHIVSTDGKAERGCCEQSGNRNGSTTSGFRKNAPIRFLALVQKMMHQTGFRGVTLQYILHPQ
jgi:hypothetical protein